MDGSRVQALRGWSTAGEFRSKSGTAVDPEELIPGLFLCDPVRFTVVVKDGIVTIAGTPETAPVGRDIVEAARHVEGVVAVRDRLSPVRS